MGEVAAPQTPLAIAIISGLIAGASLVLFVLTCTQNMNPRSLRGAKKRSDFQIHDSRPASASAPERNDIGHAPQVIEVVAPPLSHFYPF